MGQTTVSEKYGGEKINEARGPMEVYHQSLTQGRGSQLWKTHGTYTELQGEEELEEGSQKVQTSSYKINKY